MPSIFSYKPQAPCQHSFCIPVVRGIEHKAFHDVDVSIALELVKHFGLRVVVLQPEIPASPGGSAKHLNGLPLTRSC